jgi:hypothetical protein
MHYFACRGCVMLNDGFGHHKSYAANNLELEVMIYLKVLSMYEENYEGISFRIVNFHG